MTKIVIWFLTLFMPVLSCFNGMTLNVPVSSAEIIYEFANETAGSAAGTVTVNANFGEYKLYWGTEDGEKLSEDVGGYTVYYSEFATVDANEPEEILHEVYDFGSSNAANFVLCLLVSKRGGACETLHVCRGVCSRAT
jgi:hypothetical protein